MRPRLFLFVGLLVCGLSIYDSTAASKLIGPGDQQIVFTHDRRERSAIVHVPPRIAEKSPVPVVLNFHGGGGHGANQKDYSLMDALSDRESFVAVFPNGTGRLAARLLTWNAGSCCSYAVDNKVDDVGFVRALIRELAERLPIDTKRIYATGLSNGAMMAHRLAAEAGDVIAAVAPVAGGLVVPAIRSTRAVPVLHIHSVDDPRALYQGGVGPPFPLTNNRVTHPNIDDVMERWSKHNGCVAEPKIAERATDRDGRGHTAVRDVFPGCRDGAEVALWKLTGAGHVWPGGKQKYLEKIVGPSTRVIDANREMWKFFSRFSL